MPNSADAVAGILQEAVQAEIDEGLQAQQTAREAQTEAIERTTSLEKKVSDLQAAKVNGFKYERQGAGRSGAMSHGYMAIWVYGYMGVWVYGCMGNNTMTVIDAATGRVVNGCVCCVCCVCVRASVSG